jgi:tocopherol O-methyltransferase
MTVATIRLFFLLSAAQAWMQAPITPTAAENRRSSHRLYVVGTLKKTAQRVKDSLTSQERTEADLKTGIAAFYDRSSQLWEGK